VLPGRKRLASITQALVDVLDQDFNMRLHPDKVVIAPNGVELERFASLPDPVTARGQLGLREAPTVMCTDICGQRRAQNCLSHWQERYRMRILCGWVVVLKTSNFGGSAWT
jgi:hypothetical protein